MLKNIGDRYQIIEQLGQGGMGKTYLAIDTVADNKPCVVKEFFPQSASQSSWQKCRELFIREAEILAKLKHPQIPKFLDWREEQDRLFLVQEYIEGQTYWQFLQQQQSGFSEVAIKQWLKDVLPVIQFIHEQDVIHRDIAPDNIMRRSDGKPILIDFGAVKEVINGNEQSIISTRITKSGYSAPEQFRGKVSGKSDIYSLAVTAVVLLTRKTPEELIDSETNKWQWQAYTNISSDLAKILDKMLQEQPRNRYQSAAEILQDLARSEVARLAGTTFNQLQFPSTEISSQTVTKQLFFRRQGRIAIIAAVLCLVTGAGAGTWIASPHIPLVCQHFSNCAREREFQSLYQQYQQLGNKVIDAAQQAQNIQDLQAAQVQITRVIADLNTVPQDVKVFGESQQTLAEYRRQSQAIAERILREQEAKKQLEKIDYLRGEAINNTELAKTIQQYQGAQVKWQKIQQQLEVVPAAVFLSDRRKSALKESQQQQQKIKSEINRLIAAAAARKKVAVRENNKQPQSPKLLASTSNKITKIPIKKTNFSPTKRRIVSPPKRRSSSPKSNFRNPSPKIVKPWWGSSSVSPPPSKRRVW